MKARVLATMAAILNGTGRVLLQGWTEFISKLLSLEQLRISRLGRMYDSAIVANHISAQCIQDLLLARLGCTNK